MAKPFAIWLTQDGGFHCSTSHPGRRDEVRRTALALLATSAAVKAQNGAGLEALAVVYLYNARRLVEGRSPVEPERPEGVESVEDWRRFLRPERGVLCGAIFDRSAKHTIHLVGSRAAVERLARALDDAQVLTDEPKEEPDA